MDEKLISDSHQNANQLQIETQLQIQNQTRMIYAVVAAGFGYAAIMGMIYYDIHHMNQNLDWIVNLANDTITFANANVNVNATAIEDARHSLNEIAECVLHKYCRRVPE